MNENQDLVIKKLDTLIRVSLINAIEGKSLKEQVNLMSSVGLTPKEIGEFLNKTPNHISVTLNEIKNSQRKLIKKNE
jgi:hypothetical protein